MKKAHKHKHAKHIIYIRARKESKNGLAVASNFIHLLCFCITHCELIHLCTIMCTQITLTTLIINHPNILYFFRPFSCSSATKTSLRYTLLFHICAPCLEHISPSTGFSSYFLCESLQFVRSLTPCAHRIHPSVLCSTPSLLSSSQSLTLSASNFFIYCLWNFIILTQGVCFVCAFHLTPNLGNYPVVAIIVVAIRAQRAGAYLRMSAWVRA